ncbi:MAG TPA: HNH endonuclease signature motif containing protein [Patescibacteria group bacterium]|nr:HNH endonuclease signature motif containing protein [Patescibacteria group bacterium]
MGSAYTAREEIAKTRSEEEVNRWKQQTLAFNGKLKRRRKWRGGRKPAGSGYCVYCGQYFEALTWDHVVPRSLIPGPERDHPDNLVRACWNCNGSRTSGFKPSWESLPEYARAFVLSRKNAVFAERYFSGVQL